MLKCSSERCVCAPQSFSAGTSTSPRLSVSLRMSVMVHLLLDYSMRQCDTFDQPRMASRAHWVDLSLWQPVQGFGILYTSVMDGVNSPRFRHGDACAVRSSRRCGARLASQDCGKRRRGHRYINALDEIVPLHAVLVRGVRM